MTVNIMMTVQSKLDGFYKSVICNILRGESEKGLSASLLIYT